MDPNMIIGPGKIPTYPPGKPADYDQTPPTLPLADRPASSMTVREAMAMHIYAHYPGTDNGELIALTMADRLIAALSKPKGDSHE